MTKAPSTSGDVQPMEWCRRARCRRRCRRAATVSPTREGEVAPPVDRGGRAHAVVAQAVVAPDGADDAEGYRDPEHEAPVDDREQSSGDESDERPTDGRDLVDAHGEAALIRREGVDQDGRSSWRRAWRHRRPARGARARATARPSRRDRGSSARSTDAKENTAKPRLKIANAPDDVAESTEADHEHRGDEQVAHARPTAGSRRCPEPRGLMPMPRKIAGSEIRMIEELMVAMNMPRVVFVSAIHL